MARLQLVSGIAVVTVLLSILRIFVAGAYKSLWDLLWYRDVFPGPLGIVAFFATYYLVRPKPVTVGVSMVLYGVLVLLIRDITLLHVYAGIATAILVYALSWIARSPGILMAGIAGDMALRAIAAGAVPIDDPLTAFLLASIAISGGLLYVFTGHTSTPGLGIFLFMSLVELGLVYPNALLHFSGIHVYNLATFLGALNAFMVTLAVFTLLTIKKPLHTALSLFTISLLLLLASGLPRLLILYMVAAIAIPLSVTRHTASRRIEHFLSPILLVAILVAAVGVYAYPYLGLWPLADNLEVLILLTVIAIVATTYRATSTHRVSTLHLSIAILLVVLASATTITLYSNGKYIIIPSNSNVTIVSYNVHQGFTADNRLNGMEVAQYLARIADIACLQEVDAGRLTSAFMDLPLILSTRTGMSYVYQPAIEGTYGVLIASRYNIKQVDTLLLTSTGEQRAAVKAVIETPAGDIVVVSVHLGLDPKERAIQARELLRLALSPPVADVICGDLNEEEGEALQQLSQYYIVYATDTPTCCLDTTLDERIDYILLSRTSKWIVAEYSVELVDYSDHLPVIARLLTS